MGAGDDFFFTGGGFSDWSGGSAGRFSSSSLSGSSSDGKYSSSNGKKDKLTQKSNEQPIVIGRSGVIWRIMMICFLLLMQAWGAIMYIHYPDGNAYVGHGTVFISSMIYLSWYIIKNVNICYNFRSVSVWKVYIFRMLWLLTCCLSFLISAIIALTPILCHLLRYWLVEHRELFIFYFFDEYTQLYSTDYSLEHCWWVMIISGLFAWFMFSFALGLLYFIPNELKIARRMACYLNKQKDSQWDLKNFIASLKGSDTSCCFTSILSIGILFAFVMLFGAIQKYNREKGYYDSRIESQRRMDEMLQQLKEPEEDTQKVDTVAYVDVAKDVTQAKPATPPAVSHKSSSYTAKPNRSRSSGYSSGSTYSSSSHSSYDDDDDDDDTWYSDEDDADEKYEYDYWE